MHKIHRNLAKNKESRNPGQKNRSRIGFDWLFVLKSNQSSGVIQCQIYFTQHTYDLQGNIL